MEKVATDRKNKEIFRGQRIVQGKVSYEGTWSQNQN